nr:hypothetical protein [uncultured Campylobacter sp.]
MKFIAYYDSPLGKITLAGDGAGLCGLWFEGEKSRRTLLRQAAQTANSARAILRQKQMPLREMVAARKAVR